MATIEHFVKSWNANFTLNTVNESNVAHEYFKDTIEVYFTHAQPTKVEVHYQHADLDVLTGYLRFYQKGSADVEVSQDVKNLVINFFEADQEFTPDQRRSFAPYIPLNNDFERIQNE